MQVKKKKVAMPIKNKQTKKSCSNSVIFCMGVIKTSVLFALCTQTALFYAYRTSKSKMANKQCYKQERNLRSTSQAEVTISKKPKMNNVLHFFFSDFAFKSVSSTLWPTTVMMSRNTHICKNNYRNRKIIIDWLQ